MTDVRLVPWTDESLDLLRQINTPEMRAHTLGGPEDEDALLARHRRYLAMPGEGIGTMYAIVLPDGTEAGSIAYHRRTWRGEAVYETGWNVLPAHQGRGIAGAAGRALIAAVRADGALRHLHAFPSVDNAASNALCRSLGFTLLGPCDFEYPPASGRFLHSNDWRIDLG